MPLEPPSRNDGRTLPCVVCGRPFPRCGRRVFCSGACRQMAWRRRQPTPLPAVAPRSGREHTLDQCPDCDSRYLGEYCSDCGRFCRRVGGGGLCPACDEPVAISDLLPGHIAAHHPRGTGGPAPSPAPSPRTLSPQVPSAPRIFKQEVIHHIQGPGFWAILVAAIGQVH